MLMWEKRTHGPGTIYEPYEHKKVYRRRVQPRPGSDGVVLAVMFFLGVLTGAVVLMLFS